MAVRAFISAIECHFPSEALSNEVLSQQFSDWDADKIEDKTGIASRYIARENETASDLGVEACKKLFESKLCTPEEIDFLIFCTQSPDYFLPTTACLMQERLGIPTTAGAFDFNLGCSGYIYGLGLAKGLIETGQAGHVLLVMAETYSKFISEKDRSVRPLFGDAATASLIQGKDTEGSSHSSFIGPFVYGTDGSGAQNLIVPVGGLRKRYRDDQADASTKSKDREEHHLYMNGPEIFTFTLRAVPRAVQDLLSKAGTSVEEVDFFVFHQANKYMLEHLRAKVNIPKEKFCIEMSDCGNTVSSTVPIGLTRLQEQKSIKAGDLIMLVGFGVGYSWGATLVRWKV